MSDAWRVTVRVGPKVERAKAGSLEEALDELERRTRIAATATGRSGSVELRFRTFEPGDRVIVRSELSGPGRWLPAVRAGIDVRGDGSEQAWTGRVSRAEIVAERGEDAYAALRRSLQSVSVDP